jgi:hypothetical protein
VWTSPLSAFGSAIPSHDLRDTPYGTRPSRPVWSGTRISWTSTPAAAVICP